MIKQGNKLLCNFFHDKFELDIWFRIADFVILFVIPIMILVWLYSVMIAQLWWCKMTHSTHGLNKRRKAIKLFLTVVIMCFLC